MTDLWKKFESDIKPYTTHISAEEFDYTVNVSLKYSYVYIENAKVACSSIKLVLQRMELDDPKYRPEDLVDMHTRIFSPLIRPAQAGKFSEYIRRENVVKFCFVRNPYTRLLSAYLDKIENNMPAKKEILSMLGHDPGEIERSISFKEFVDVVVKQPVSEMNLHWRIQYYQTFQEQIDYDVVGRFESLDDDLRRVLEIINPQFEKYWGREERHATNSSQHLQVHYTDEIEDLVYRKYQKDFQYFNYPRI